MNEWEHDYDLDKDKRTNGWHSCESCQTRLTEELCLNVGCIWIKDVNIYNGICISQSLFLSLSSSSWSLSWSGSGESLNLTCEILSKEQCNIYTNTDNTHSENVSIINNAPCILNRVSNYNNNDIDIDTFHEENMNIYSNSLLSCVSKSSFEKKGCESIKTNFVMLYEGEERETCNEAHIIFGYTEMCGWAKKYEENDGYCGHIYYLTENSIIISFFFFIYVLIYLFGYFYLFIYLYKFDLNDYNEILITREQKYFEP
jgi:hypothetical protein